MTARRIALVGVLIGLSIAVAAPILLLNHRLEQLPSDEAQAALVVYARYLNGDHSVDASVRDLLPTLTRTPLDDGSIRVTRASVSGTCWTIVVGDGPIAPPFIGDAAHCRD